MTVCSGSSSGMEMYDVSQTRNADAYLVIILLNFCNLWFLNCDVEASVSLHFFILSDIEVAATVVVALWF